MGGEQHTAMGGGCFNYKLFFSKNLIYDTFWCKIFHYFLINYCMPMDEWFQWRSLSAICFISCREEWRLQEIPILWALLSLKNEKMKSAEFFISSEREKGRGRWEMHSVANLLWKLHFFNYGINIGLQFQN